MDPSVFLRTPAIVRQELAGIMQRRNSQKATIKQQVTALDAAHASIVSSQSAVKDTAMGAGMSAQALDAVNPEKTGIKMLFVANGVIPAKESINGAKSAINEL